MKGMSIILTATFLLLTSSCSNTYSNEDLGLDYDEKQILFFSNEADYHFEAPYYEAIIELKKKYPDEINNMKVLSGEKASKYYKTFEIDQSPALLVYYQDKVIVNIHGKVSKDDIVQPITKILSN